MGFAEDLAGEDIHFSYVAQKYLGLPTLVPPHPPGNLALWGSNPNLARELGSGKESLSQSNESLKRFENALQHYRKLGFETLAERGDMDVRYPNIVYFIIRRFPKLSHQMAKKFKAARSFKRNNG